MRFLAVIGVSLLLACAAAGTIRAEEGAAEPHVTQVPVSERYLPADVSETPSFQRHVSPLFGRLGCNGRSCHGSFQGRGDFRLSLFGYDFKADHDALMDEKSPRINKDNPLESLILAKPTDADVHEGGKRYEKDGWQYNVFRRWIESGAKFEKGDIERIARLEITPAEILFSAKGDKTQLKAVAVWADGTREDVTCLCRFQSNSDQVATITADGLVTATEPGDTHVVVFYDSAVVPIPVLRPVSDLVGDKYPQTPTPTKVDELVIQKLSKLGVVQSDVCTDGEFLRRVSLDLTGTLPTATQAEAFINNPSPNKRTEKIDELLSTPAYAAWWTTKLCDWTGNNDTQLNNFGMRGKTSQEWYDWIYKRVAENAPYDELVADIVLATSRNSGQSYTEFCEDMTAIYRDGSEKTFADRETMPYYWARTNLRKPEEKAIGFAYTFLGIRIQCAQCHKHPFDQWSKDDFDAFKGFFTRVTVAANGGGPAKKEYEEIIAKLGLDSKLKGNDLQKKLPAMVKEGKTIPFAEVTVLPAKKPVAVKEKGNKGKRERELPPATARVLGGAELDLNSEEDPRRPLMEWLRQKDNPYFARALVNRVWSNYFNVGIVQPADDLSLANPPSNKALLDHLTAGFVDHNYDLKWLHREIAGSRTYQLSWQPNATNAKDERNFARAVPRRLPAEVAYDALLTATASDAKAAAMTTELKGRGIAVPGSNARQNGGNNAAYALQVFGRSIRESNCDCDRSMEASLLQTVYLHNDTNVLAAVNGGKESWIEQLTKKPSTKLSDGSDIAKLDVKKETRRMQARLEKAKKDGDDKQVNRLERRLAEIEEADLEQKEAKPGEMTVDAAEFVRQAYLRTLTRYPTPDEVARCNQFLAEASSPAEGARGLLWTLINTKEFIVNH
jgi:hypothetical protein